MEKQQDEVLMNLGSEQWWKVFTYHTIKISSTILVHSTALFRISLA